MRTKVQFLIIVLCTLNVLGAIAQTNDSVLNNSYANSSDLLFDSNKGIGLGGYGEVHFNKPFAKDLGQLGTADVHRIVMFMGYSFDEKTQFVSEIEFEYAKELWVEQAYLQHKINKYATFKSGLLLVPMGIINEYHEPTTFHGVERPTIDNKINPSTWREIGIGLTGSFIPASIKYQAYIVTGLLGYDDKGILNGEKGIRDGRQKGSKAITNSPCITGKIEYYGIKSLNLGISGYGGKSQSKLYNNIDKTNTMLLDNADSSQVGIAMLGVDGRYKNNGLEVTCQLYYTEIYNTYKYNVFTAVDGVANNLGNSMLGWYTQLAYNILQLNTKSAKELLPFVRYEYYNTQQSVVNGITLNEKYRNYIITTGLTYKLTKFAVLKTDVQFQKNGVQDSYSKIFNAGFSVMF